MKLRYIKSAFSSELAIERYDYQSRYCYSRLDFRRRCKSPREESTCSFSFKCCNAIRCITQKEKMRPFPHKYPLSTKPPPPSTWAAKSKISCFIHKGITLEMSLCQIFDDCEFETDKFKECIGRAIFCLMCSWSVLETETYSGCLFHSVTRDPPSGFKTSACTKPFIWRWVCFHANEPVVEWIWMVFRFEKEAKSNSKMIYSAYFDCCANDECLKCFVL